MFQVNDYLFYGDSLNSIKENQLKNPSNISNLTISNIKDPKFVMFVSGLSIDGDMNEELALSSQLLVDFVSGRLGGEEENKIASCITRVIISGNSIL